METDEVVLELPPLPGTDDAHPAFELKKGNGWIATMRDGMVLYACGMSRSGATVRLISGAISKLWSLHSETLEPDTADQYYAIEQETSWEKILLGSLEIEKIKIITYQPRGKA